MSNLEGKVVVVTGASSGIGRTTALRLASAGAKVVVAARRVVECQAVAEQIQGAGGEAVAVRADVTVESDVEAMVQAAVDAFGRLDCAFNNAARLGGRPEPWTEVDESMFDEFINPNLRGVWLCMKHEMRAMKSQGGGSIVNNSSIGGLKGGPPNSHMYAASKHGVIGLTRNAAMNYGKFGIRVNAVCPGIIGNEVWLKRFKKEPERREQIENRVPLGRLGTEDEVADSVIWLCSDSSSYVTGTSLLIDGGFTENVMP